jgi:hypothetical protein
MNALLELAERCEAATGPDRELSAEIALVVHDWLHEVEGNKPLNCRLRNSFGSPVYIGGVSPTMDYTASLDAAMTLVPEGHNWFRERGAFVPFIVSVDGPACRYISECDSSLPLALCAAANGLTGFAFDLVETLTSHARAALKGQLTRGERKRPQQGTEEQPWCDPMPETPMPDGPQ